MVADESDNLYPGTTEARRVITIHEIGHQFGAHHDDGDTNPLLDSPGYNRATSWPPGVPLHGTVMWHWYIQGFNTYEFSSSWPNHHGDPAHDNARRIRETKTTVSGYAVCSASPPSTDFYWRPDIQPLHTGQLIRFSPTNINLTYYYYWDLGDGSGSSEIEPEWAYTVATDYPVKLTVANCAGSSTTEHIVTITQSPNHVSFVGNPITGDAPLNVQFSGSATPPAESYNWSFGDGYTSSAQNPQHTYYQNGSFTVILTVVQDGAPNTKILQNYITVAPQAPNASFTSFINTGSVPLSIQFIDTSINNPTSWNWSFDDNTRFNTTDPLQKNVSHTFTTARTYNVTLTAGNALGSSTAYQLITATNTPAPTDTSPFEKTGAGLYTYTSPAGIYSINITIVGAGGGGGGGTYDSVSGMSNGGFGGNASQVLNITQIISPGSVIPVKVGVKGSGGNGHCGQINGNPGSDGGYSDVGNIIASGGLGGRGGGYSSTTSHGDGYPGQNGYGNGTYATSGQSIYPGIGGAGGIGRGAGGGGASGSCTGVGGNGADGYVKIQPIISPPLANFTATPTSGSAPLTVRFTDISTGSLTSRIWDFGDGNTTNATMQNPVHTYWLKRSFNVSLTAINAGGSNTTTKVRYIKVTNMTDIGVFRSGQWILDYDIDGVVDRRFNYGVPNDTPVIGDFNNDGQTDIGVFRSGQWILDYGIDGTVDRRVNYGASNDTPVVGDFNNDGQTDIGVFRSGQWILDYGINGTVDRRVNYGASNDTPVVGDFNNDGQTDIGIFRSGQWLLDYGIDGGINRQFPYGLPTDVPVAGDFNNDGTMDIGVFRSGQWILDYGIDGTVNRRFNYGLATDKAVVGDFNNWR